MSRSPSRLAVGSRLLAEMVRAVRQGGRIARQNYLSHRLQVTEKSSPGDLVSSVDLAVEEQVIRTLARRFPGIPVASEERENPAAGAEAFHLDPLDGTLNFVHGLTPFAVSLGYWRDGAPVAAAVLVVTEAGGRVSFLSGGDFRLEDGEVAATNGRIHDELLACLRG